MHIVWKKIAYTLSVVAMLLAPAGYSAHAEQSQLFFGQDHSYTVIFRGNGEAIVYAKLVVPNPNDTPLTETSFEVPGVTPSEMTIYQMHLPDVCARYDYSTSSRPCVEYQDPDYTSAYYYYGYGSRGSAVYDKVQYSVTGQLYHLTLPKPVAPNKSTALIIAYAAKGYAHKFLGLFSYDFQTIKVPARVTETTVSVDVDSDLYLQGKRSSVAYNTSRSADIGTAYAATTGLSSTQLDNVVGQIGSYGPVVKSAKNLAPSETFEVKGEYATSKFRLYVRPILISLLILVGIFVAIHFGSRYAKRRHKNEPPTGGAGAVSVGVTSPAPVPANHQTTVSFLNMLNASIGLLSAALVIGFTFLVQFLGNGGLMYSLGGSTAIYLLILVGIFLLYVMAIFVPAILVAVKHGWKAFVSVLIAEILWIAIFILIYFALFHNVDTNTTPRYPSYYYGY